MKVIIFPDDVIVWVYKEEDMKEQFVRGTEIVWYELSNNKCENMITTREWVRLLKIFL